LYPHERSLVEQYRGRPFVLLGVNSDDDRGVVQEAIRRHGINWRSWFIGGTDGDIPRQWGVSNWPTVFIIDARGVVRHRLTSFENVERLIEPLLREVE
jgi:alkyl hydroperoxide reductase subunit AhpC